MYDLPQEPMKPAKQKSEPDSMGHPVTVEPSGYQAIPAQPAESCNVMKNIKENINNSFFIWQSIPHF